MTGLNETIAALRRRRNELVPSSVSKRMRPITDFGANPGALHALVYAPENLHKSAALVVALHGCTQSGQGYAESAGWLQLADRHGFAVLAPEQTRANNPSLCFNWFERNDISRGQGEVASIAEMVAHLVATEMIDPKRVFITGLSAGGAMSAAMLAAYPELFVAGAVIAGVPVGAAHNMQSAFSAMARTPNKTGQEWGDAVRAPSGNVGPWPRISIWHGDADIVVRPTAAEALVRQWTDVQGVEDQTPERVEDSGRRRAVWKSANGEPVVEHHQMLGMGHGTPLCTSGPDGCGIATTYMLDVGVSSSLESAVSWGIATSSDAARTEVLPFAKPRELPAQKQAYAGGLDVNAIITSALRTAGLLK